MRLRNLWNEKATVTVLTVAFLGSRPVLDCEDNDGDDEAENDHHQQIPFGFFRFRIRFLVLHCLIKRVTRCEHAEGELSDVY